MKYIAIGFCVLLHGCATLTASRSFDPEHNPDKGLVLVSFNQSFKEIKWMYRNLNNGKGVKGLNENFISTTELLNNLIHDNQRIIYPFHLKPGKYEFFRWTLPEFNHYYKSTNDFSIEFEVHPGKVTYIGNVMMLVAGSPSQYKIGVRDQSDSDIAKFLAVYPNVSANEVVKDIAVFKGFSH